MASYSRIPVLIPLSANATSPSNPVAVPPGQVIVGLYLDSATWVSTSMTFQTSPQSGAGAGVVDNGSGTAVSKTVTAGRYIPLDPATFAGVDEFIIIFGGQETIAHNCMLVTSTLGGMS